jgi:hypothetical protein
LAPAAAGLAGVAAALLARLRVAAGPLPDAPAALARERAGVSAGAAGLAAPAGALSAPAAGPRLALRRAGRVRGRLVRTSRSLPLAEESLGGMARLLPIPSGKTGLRPKAETDGVVSCRSQAATVLAGRRL